ncbi:MAG: hypothetical protein AAF492_29840, partial [Verrucomicrobiota bacterium]
PTDPQSLLAITSIIPGATNMVLSWSSVSNRSYSIWSCRTLYSNDWQCVATQVMATPPLNALTCTPSVVDRLYYRIRVD